MSTKKRCNWCLIDQLYIDYHDNEWGRPIYDDQHLFEHLILETFQAGLSWYTILKKRENFRTAFKGFDPKYMSRLKEKDIKLLLLDKGIIRHRKKIEAAIHNAEVFLKIQKQHKSFSNYVWQFTNHKVVKIKINTDKDVQTTTVFSDNMSLQMKRDGFKFVGSTTCMAYMEAVGMISDHYSDCWLANYALQ